MIIGAFLDANLEIEYLDTQIQMLNLPNIKLNINKVVKNGISATKFDVQLPHEHAHRGLKEISEIINGSELSDRIKHRSLKIFNRLAEAEGKIHDKPPEEIHFHEVGALDAIVDIVGAVICLDFFGFEKIYASEIRVGSGSIEAAHGTLPVPVPAVLELLKGIPLVDSNIKTEIVTPTGAAIISTLCTDFGIKPKMTIEKTAYGAGSKDLPIANVLRVLIGESKRESKGLISEEIYKLETNIDDMNPQLYEHVMEVLFDAGALDVFLAPIIMKKNRPGTLLSVLCHENELHKLVDIIIRETTSLGVRFQKMERLITSRRFDKVSTKWGDVRIKIAEINGQIVSKVPEYEDCLNISRKNNIPLKDIYTEINRIVSKG